jgi:tripartite-type tricarboxylate transporter receptor subunit TctC
VKKIVIAFAAVASLAFGAAAVAQDYPNRPIKMVVPFPPGGPTDIVARLLASEMSKGLGQTVIIENTPGAGGNIGTQAVVRAAPDGYTLLMGTLQNIGINRHLFKLPFDPLTDLDPVSMVVKNPNVMIANSKLPFDNLQGFISYAKANPGKVFFASSGNGSSTHLSGELLNRMAGLSLVHVPYKGSAPALADLIGGQVQVSFDNVVSAYPHIKGGKVKPIAVTTSDRVPSLPEVPTMKEQGLPKFETAGWSAVFVPANTPAAIVQRLNVEVHRALAVPRIAEKLESDGAYPAPNSSADFRRSLKAESEQWGEVIRAANIKLQ